MNRADLHRLVEIRIAEAEALLNAGQYNAAYYLVGYAVECALKACIAKQTREFDFPPEPKFVREIYTHNLDELRTKVGVELDKEFKKELQSNGEFAGNWGTLKDWSEDSRYKTDISEKAARGLHAAITDPQNGILQWLKKWW
jgi:HEPN domain-containing protein